MRRGLGVGYAAVTAAELVYVLYTNLPSLNPPRYCRTLCGLDEALRVQPPFPWPWIALSILLLLSAIAVMLRLRFSLAAGFVAQFVLLLDLVRDLGLAIGGTLSSGSAWSGIDAWFPQVLFDLLALSGAVGPALALLLLMTTRSAEPKPRAARTAALLLAAQLVALVGAALLSFPAAFRGCDYNGPGAFIIDDAPGCADFADLDFGRLFAMAVPTVAVLLLVCVGVWRRRNWSLTAGIVWQVCVALILITLAATLPTEPSQNYWYDRFPTWTSPRWLAEALLLIGPIPALTALLVARSARLRGWRLLWSPGH